MRKTLFLSHFFLFLSIRKSLYSRKRRRDSLEHGQQRRQREHRSERPVDRAGLAPPFRGSREREQRGPRERPVGPRGGGARVLDGTGEVPVAAALGRGRGTPVAAAVEAAAEAAAADAAAGWTPAVGREVGLLEGLLFVLCWLFFLCVWKKKEERK